MRPRTYTQLIVGLMLVATLALPVQLAAQQTRYKLIDLGTFGGPASYLTDPGNGPGFLVLNDAGALVGRSDTGIFDPILGDYRAHAFRWEKNALTDLGTPAGAVFSAANGVNAVGLIAIDYSAAQIDPLTGGPIFRGALWNGGQFVDLGTLGGGQGLETDALYVNNAGAVVGFSTINTTPDPFSFLGASIHPFVWQNAIMHDLGTLGGPDAGVSSNCNNPRSNLVTGTSLMNSTPNPDTGIPTSHPYLWENGNMIDLGLLGGTLTGVDVGIGVQCVNNAGQVAGTSFLAGNSNWHAFLWENGVMRDLGTLGGDNSQATWINYGGDIVGEADLPSGNPDIHHAFLYRNGAMIDLGTLGSTSHAIAINAKGQVVGRSRIGDPSTELQHALLWENGGPVVDLNTLISPNSPLELYDAENINDAGWIAGRGLPAGCSDKDTCGHAFLLIPCDPAAGQDCSPVTATPSNAAIPNKQTATPVQQRSTSLGAWRARLAQRYHNFSSSAPLD
jgi:probable HAF family extracellular repeat protein